MENTKSFHESIKDCEKKYDLVVRGNMAGKVIKVHNNTVEKIYFIVPSQLVKKIKFFSISLDDYMVDKSNQFVKIDTMNDYDVILPSFMANDKIKLKLKCIYLGSFLRVGLEFTDNINSAIMMVIKFGQIDDNTQSIKKINLSLK